jgi:4-diphosphocytidyl-2-C-methyl-D-erythritol kinase
LITASVFNLPNSKTSSAMIKLRSFAKINLGLEITGKRADGYHTLRTIFQTIDVCDELQLRENKKQKVTLSGTDPRIPWDESNTIVRACRLIHEKYGVNQGFDITIKKNIPPGSGLGGGSGNAAVMLLFLNQYFNLRIPLAEMTILAAKIGSDVPFFLSGGTMLGEGIGESLTVLPEITPRPIALFIPSLQVSTALIFSRFSLTKTALPSKIQLFLQRGDFSALENELENVTFDLFPEIREIKQKMLQGGCDFVQMTGSGSAVFGLGPQEKLVALANLSPGVALTRTIDRKYYQEKIGVWPSGKASAFGAEIRRFESYHPRKTKC